VNLLRDPNFRGFFIGLSCALACSWLSGTRVVRGLENWTLDRWFVLRGERSGPTELVIIALDDATLENQEKPLIFWTPELAEVVSFVRRQGAKAVGIDLMIPDSVNKFVNLAPDDLGDATTLGRIIGEDGCPVVLPEFMVPGDKPIFPLRQWQTPQMRDQIDFLGETVMLIGGDLMSMGYVNVLPDSDMYVRRQRLREWYSLDSAEAGTEPETEPEGDFEPSLALAVYASAHGLDEECLYDLSLPRGGAASPASQGPRLPIPLDEDGNLVINYRGPAGTIPYVSFHEVLRDAKSQQTNHQWKDKIVLIGTSAHSLPDHHATPFVNPSLWRLFSPQGEPKLMPGVEVHANVVATLGDRDFITTPWLLSTPPVLLAAGPLLGVAMMRLNLPMSLLVAVAHHFLWKILSLASFISLSWHLPVVAMSLLGASVFTVVFAMRWRWIRRTLGMIKSEPVAQALETDPVALSLKGEEREITIMFADVRGFTKISENSSAREVVELLNQYFSVAAPVIERFGGVVNLYMGDGLLALFNAPQELPDHAASAVRAAVEMVRQVRRWAEREAPNFGIGVGIHTGPVVIGCVGARDRFDYAPIGDTVNAAARIESATRELQADILVSAQTLARIPQDARDIFALVGEPRKISVKGKLVPLIVHTIEVPSRPYPIVEQSTAAATSFESEEIA
jgi:adenylate cyclase